MNLQNPWPRAAFFPTLANGQLDLPEPRVDEAEARDLSEQWRQRCCLDEARFALRLSTEGFDVSSFGRLLAARVALREEGESGSRREAPPVWQTLVSDVLDRWNDLSASPRRIVPGAPFAAPMHPFIAYGLRRIERSLPAIAGLALDGPEIREALYRELARRFDEVCRRVLVLELHVARIEERLEGDTGEARFQHYCRLLEERTAWESLFAEYQVTARAVATTLSCFAAAVTELFTRLAADIEDLRAEGLVDPRPQRLVDARGGLSDLHRRGRSVWILDLVSASGQGLSRLVYKPRSLGADTCFQRLMTWIGARTEDGSLRLGEQRFPRFRPIRMLARESHGWVEHLAHEPCTSREGVARFYQRQGGYLAILYLLRAMDLHSENLIACGEHPMLIDLEAIFHREDIVEAPESAAFTAIERLHASVVRIGLLPNKVFGEAGKPGANISALGDDDVQLAPFLGATWDQTGTDEMGMVLRPRGLMPAENLPRFEGKAIAVSAHTQDLLAGFESMYRLLRASRETLLATGGILDAFAHVEVRHVVRATRSYGQILDDKGHPDHQRDAADVEALLDMLWLMDRNKAQIHRVIPSERADLREGDVPIFLTRPGSRDLWDSRGERIPDYFATDGITEVKNRLRAFSADDLRAQSWLVRASLATLRPAHRQGTSNVDHPDSRPILDIARQRANLVAAAQRIGDKLLASVIEGPRDVTWIGVGLTAGDQCALSPVGSDLYEGTAGIGLFLGCLGQVTGQARFTAMARRIAEALAVAAEGRSDDTPVRLGGFLGEGAELYAMAYLSRLLGDPTLLTRATRRLERFSRSPATPVGSDVISGDAGSILGLVAVHRIGDVPSALTAALARAEALCDRGAGDLQSLWPEGDPPLLGFSHGAAGIAHALFTLTSTLPHDHDATRIHALTARLLDHERSHFDAASGNWPRLEKASSGGPITHGNEMIAWCHGAPGVALGRLDMLEDPEARREIEIAVGTTLARGMRKSHILCHGDLGNLMIVRRAAEALDRNDWRAEAAWHTGRILSEIERGGPVFGTAIDDVSQGLSCGLAGVGYGLLYQAHPEVVPLVLGLVAG